jgi:hypothetical protein
MQAGIVQFKIEPKETTCFLQCNLTLVIEGVAIDRPKFVTLKSYSN